MRNRPLLILMCGVAAAAFGCEDSKSDTGLPGYCPDPEDPCVTYFSEDPEECENLDTYCEDDQTGFGGNCGCGCIDEC